MEFSGIFATDFCFPLEMELGKVSELKCEQSSCGPRLPQSYKTQDSNELGLTCSTRLWSKLYALGRPSRVEKATLAPVRGDISLNSSVHRAVRSSSPGRMKVFASFPQVFLQEALQYWYGNHGPPCSVRLQMVKLSGRLVQNFNLMQVMSNALPVGGKKENTHTQARVLLRNRTTDRAEAGSGSTQAAQ